MGWSFGYSSEQEAVLAELGSEAKVLRQARGERGVWVIEEYQGKRAIAIVLMERRGPKFGAKVVHEVMGPAYWDCPLGFLDEVPCPKSVYAVGWRQKVMAVNGKRIPLAELANAV